MRKVNFKKGGGEFVAFAVLAPILCWLIICLVSFYQLTSALDDMTEAVNVCSRGASICMSLSDAETQAQLLALSSIESGDIENVDVSIEYATADDTWGSGVLIKVTISADVKTFAPFMSPGRIEEASIVAIENVDIQQDEVNMLAAIIASEAGSTNPDLLSAIGTVIINRINSSSYPDKLEDVISRLPTYNSQMYKNYLRTGAPAQAIDIAYNILDGGLHDKIEQYYVCKYTEHISDTGVNAENTYPRGFDIGGMWFYY